MLQWAYELNISVSPIKVDLSHVGFGTKVIQGRGLRNLSLGQADVHALPLDNESIDIGLSINVIDRVTDPKQVISELHRVLKKGGTFIFANPLNWLDVGLWEHYPSAESIITMFTDIGFTIIEWFDGLYYREIKDARGSFEEWKTLHIKAMK